MSAAAYVDLFNQRPKRGFVLVPSFRVLLFGSLAGCSANFLHQCHAFGNIVRLVLLLAFAFCARSAVAVDPILALLQCIVVLVLFTAFALVGTVGWGLRRSLYVLLGLRSGVGSGGASGGLAVRPGGKGASSRAARFLWGGWRTHDCSVGHVGGERGGALGRRGSRRDDLVQRQGDRNIQKSRRRAGTNFWTFSAFYLHKWKVAED